MKKNKKETMAFAVYTTPELRNVLELYGVEEDCFHTLMRVSAEQGDIVFLDTGTKEISMDVQGRTWVIGTDNKPPLTLVLHLDLAEIEDSKETAH